MNKLYYGDNLEVLRDKMPDESVDLIYLDPPFQSEKNYNIKMYWRVLSISPNLRVQSWYQELKSW